MWVRMLFLKLVIWIIKHIFPLKLCVLAGYALMRKWTKKPIKCIMDLNNGNNSISSTISHIISI